MVVSDVYVSTFMWIMIFILRLLQIIMRVWISVRCQFVIKNILKYGCLVSSWMLVVLSKVIKKEFFFFFFMYFGFLFSV